MNKWIVGIGILVLVGLGFLFVFTMTGNVITSSIAETKIENEVFRIDEIQEVGVVVSSNETKLNEVIENG
ncbi:MAG: hypothetical protein V1888_04105 [archaeon]